MPLEKWMESMRGVESGSKYFIATFRFKALGLKEIFT